MVWAVLYSGQFECATMWALCVNFGIACGFPVVCGQDLAPLYAMMKTLGFRSYTPLSWAMKGASLDYMQLSCHLSFPASLSSVHYGRR